MYYLGMNIELAQDIVQNIQRLSDEMRFPEAADQERMAYQAVLVAIANGSPEPAALARCALEATKIEFPRWF